MKNDAKGHETDESELTIQSGEKVLKLIKGKQVPYNEYMVHLVYLPTGTTYDLKIGGAFELKGQSYQVKDIDTSAGRVLINDTATGKEVWVSKADPSAAKEPAVPVK